VNGHNEAHAESRRMCQLLEEGLTARIPDLTRSPTKKWCGLHQRGHYRFAYLQHHLTNGSVEVWCRGRLAELRGHGTELDVRIRDEIKPGWAEGFPARFTLSTPSEVTEAVGLLHRVSLPLARK